MIYIEFSFLKTCPSSEQLFSKKSRKFYPFLEAPTS